MTSARPIIAVTGSSGLIGSAVIERLVSSYHMIGFDREGPPHPPAEAECVSLDLTSASDIEKALSAVRARHGPRLASVIHLAAYYSFSESDSPKYDEITVKGTERLLKALKSFDVEQFIFSSTMLVHAPCKPGERIDENSRVSPKWAYPRSKVQTEELIKSLRGDIPTVIMRISGIYDDRCRSIPIAHQIQRIYERKLTSHFFPGDMDHGQAFLHLEDLVDLTSLIVERRKQLPSQFTIVVGEEETLSFRELQTMMAQLLYGQSWWTLPVPKALAKIGAWLQMKLRVGDSFIKPWMIDLADDHYALDISRTKSTLGWQPKRSLRQTLPKMIAALKANPREWYKINKLNDL